MYEEERCMTKEDYEKGRCMKKADYEEGRCMKKADYEEGRCMKKGTQGIAGGPVGVGGIYFDYICFLI
jgi:hypothetical protein